MSGRRVLITGAGGFVGRALVDGFAELGWRVVGADRAFDGEEGGRVRRAVRADRALDDGEGDRVRRVVGADRAPGVGDGDRVRRVVADLVKGVPEQVPPADLVIHAAWVTTDPGASGIPRRAYFAANLLPLAATLGYVLRARPAAFVFLSSSGVFAPGDAAEGLTDAHEPTGDSPYAVAKRAGEDLTLGALAGGATTPHVARLGYLYGPGEVARPSRPRVSPVARWLDAAGGGLALEVRSDDPRREWTYAPDLAAALARVVDGPAAGRPIHVGSPHVSRDSEVAALVAAAFPGTEIVTVPAVGRSKAPMIPSDVPGLSDFTWTGTPAGVRSLVAARATSAPDVTPGVSA